MSKTIDSIKDGLAKPFEASEEKTREQGGKTFTYAQIQTYERRLDEVMGLAGWQCRYEFGKQGEIVCYLGLLLDGEWVWKADGAGQTNFEAEKGGLTDAFKRACKRFGLGRYLYDKGQDKKLGKKIKAEDIIQQQDEDFSQDIADFEFDPAYCKIHDCTMPERFSKDKKSSWFSHQDENGKWCKG